MIFTFDELKITEFLNTFYLSYCEVNLEHILINSILFRYLLHNTSAAKSNISGNNLLCKLIKYTFTFFRRTLNITRA